VQTRAEVARLRDIYAAECAQVGREPDWVLRRYIRLGEREQIEAEWLPGFVDRNLAYWRHSTEGPNEQRLFERLDAGEELGAVGRCRGHRGRRCQAAGDEERQDAHSDASVESASVYHRRRNRVETP
jgi:hypothetical protein